MHGVSMIGLLQASPVLDLLLVLAIATLAFAVERWTALRRAACDVPALAAAVRSAFQTGGARAAAERCAADRTPGGRVAGVLVASIDRRDLGTGVAVEGLIDNERRRLERRLDVFTAIAVSAPLAGVVGAAGPILRLMRELEADGAYTAPDIGAGTVEAMVSTALAIVVAVGATLVHRALMRRVAARAAEMEEIHRALWSALRTTGGTRGQKLAAA
jgi:biopolymer transport protein ExbB/TolQ